MMKIKCMIVDDEPLAIRLIENHISKIDSMEIVGTCNSPVKAFEMLNRMEVDLLFLDINMPDMTGLDFLRTVKNPPNTILTTAHREFALDGYDLDVVDYLLKPITFDRFFKAVNRFMDKKLDLNIPTEKRTDDEFVLLKSGTKYHKVQLRQIVFIESFKDYLNVHTTDGEIISTKKKISTMEEELIDKSFIRVHRSFIINIDKIKAFTLHDISVDGKEVPIGASYKDKVGVFLDLLKRK